MLKGAIFSESSVVSIGRYWILVNIIIFSKPSGQYHPSISSAVKTFIILSTFVNLHNFTYLKPSFCNHVIFTQNTE